MEAGTKAKLLLAGMAGIAATAAPELLRGYFDTPAGFRLGDDVGKKKLPARQKPTWPGRKRKPRKRGR